MQVSVETIEGLERKMTIAVPSEQVDSAVNQRLQEATKTIQLKGFRKGRVPFKVVKSKFGKGVRAEVVNELMSSTYYDAINQESLKPAGQPRIEPTNIEEGKDLEFVATFEVYPDIALPDFGKLKIERLSAEVTDKDIDEMIETLREQRQTWEIAEREARNEDMVNIDFLGKKKGEEFEGGSAKGTNLVLGSEKMIPGFEDGIIGKSAGDEFTISLDFPADYHNKELAGQAVQFEICLNTVSAKVLPKVDEEFYKSFGVEDGGVEAFREEISNNMDREMKAASRNKIKNKVMDALIETVDVNVPEALVGNEIQQLKAQAMQQMGGGQGAEPSMLPDDLFIEQAKRRVVLGLVLGEVIKDQNVQPDPAIVREKVEELASTYESPEEVINWYYGNKEQLASIESSVVEDQVFDIIIQEASVSDKQVSYQDVIKPEARETEAKTAESES